MIPYVSYSLFNELPKQMAVNAKPTYPPAVVRLYTLVFFHPFHQPDNGSQDRTGQARVELSTRLLVQVGVIPLHEVDVLPKLLDLVQRANLFQRHHFAHGKTAMAMREIHGWDVSFSL